MTPIQLHTEPAANDIPEWVIQSRGVKLLKMLGFAVYNLSQARASKQSPGLPDSIVTGHGVVAMVEWKRAKGRQTNAQIVFQREVEANGGTYVVFRSVEDAAEWANAVREARAVRVRHAAYEGGVRRPASGSGGEG